MKSKRPRSSSASWRWWCWSAVSPSFSSSETTRRMPVAKTGVEVPKAPIVLSAADDGTLELQLVLEPA